MCRAGRVFDSEPGRDRPAFDSLFQQAAHRRDLGIRGRAVFRALAFAHHGGTDRAVVTLSDPAKLNVLSAELTIQLKHTLQELVGDRRIRTVVLTGADPGFSAGGDLRMMEEAPTTLASPEGATDIWRWIRYEFGAVARLIARSDTAFIAALNGPAAGVGLAWALTCDLIIASEKARNMTGQGINVTGGMQLH